MKNFMKTLAVLTLVLTTSTACSAKMSSGDRDKLLIGGAVIIGGAIIGNQISKNRDTPVQNIQQASAMLVPRACDNKYNKGRGLSGYNRNGNHNYRMSTNDVFFHDKRAHGECYDRFYAYDDFKKVYRKLNSRALSQNKALQNVVDERYRLERSGGNTQRLQKLRNQEAQLLRDMSYTDLNIRDWQLQLRSLQQQYKSSGGKFDLMSIYQYDIGAASVYVPLI